MFFSDAVKRGKPQRSRCKTVMTTIATYVQKAQKKPENVQISIISYKYLHLTH